MTAREKHLPVLTELIRRREWSCVTLSSRLIQVGTAGFPSRTRDRVYFCRTHSDQVGAVLVHTRNGMILPCIGDSPECHESLKQQLGDRIRRGGVTMMMGTDTNVRTLESIMPTSPNHAVLYDLLVLDPAQVKAFNEESWYQIRPAVESDMEAILPLQRQYEVEEVLLPGRRYNEVAVRRNLQQRLKDQLVYLAIAGNVPIAMAGTNARGFDYDQIGGVFTHGPYRNRGVSTALMYRLAEHTRDEGRSLCLFVKPANHAALHMYLRMGFNIKDRFRISYYQP